jgi:hypothetical protein
LAVMWADVSYYQPGVNDDYPHPVLAIRSNDGTYRDTKFKANYQWARSALADGRLAALIVYCVYRPNWEATANTLIDMVGTPPPELVVMIDVESWGRQISGDHSGNINSLYWRFAAWLGDRRRVIGYGNRGDLDSLWPVKPQGVQLVVASYGGTTPTYPGMLAHQYGSDIACDPFGPCDGNRADQHTLQTLLTTLGIRKREREVLHDMERLPATPMPGDPNSDPRTWPGRNYTVYFDVAGGWEGDCAIAFGCQDWVGRNGDSVRAYLEIASWKMPDGTFVPVHEGNATPYVRGQGRSVTAHGQGCLLGPWLAPQGSIGITLNYAAPGEGCAPVGRSA